MALLWSARALANSVWFCMRDSPLLSITHTAQNKHTREDKEARSGRDACNQYYVHHVLLYQVLTVYTLWSFAAHKHVLHCAPASQRIPKNTAEPTFKCRTARSVQLHAHWRALI